MYLLFCSGGPGGSGDFVTGRPRNNREGRLEINPAAQEDLPQGQKHSESTLMQGTCQSLTLS